MSRPLLADVAVSSHGNGIAGFFAVNVIRFYVISLTFSAKNQDLKYLLQ